MRARRAKLVGAIGAVIITSIVILAVRRQDSGSHVTPEIKKLESVVLTNMRETLRGIESSGDVPAKTGLAGNAVVTKSQNEMVAAAPRTRPKKAAELYASTIHSPFRKTQRKEILSRLSKDASLIELSETYLNDLALVKTEMGERQAEARLLAIALLEERAKTGDISPLMTTTKKLVATLKGNENRKSGQVRDLEDLVATYVSLKRSHVAQDFEGFLRDFGYTPDLKKIFTVGVFLGLQGEYSREQITEIVNDNQIMDRLGT